MKYARENFIFVDQDVRGRCMSEGKFEDVRPFNKNKKGKEIDEASDTYDAIDWLIKNITRQQWKSWRLSAFHIPDFILQKLRSVAILLW